MQQFSHCVRAPKGLDNRGVGQGHFSLISFKRIQIVGFVTVMLCS